MRRTSELHGELAAIADVQPAWWLVAGGAAAAEPLRPRATYVVSDADPSGDTFMGAHAAAPADPIADAIARAHAARAAVRELDGQLPEQPLAVTIRRGNGAGAHTVASALDVVAFAIGDRCITARLAADIAAEGPLARRLAAALSDAPDGARSADRTRRTTGIDGVTAGAETPFACIALGAEPLATARHGHRRAWSDGAGPWLGVSRAGDLAVVSTCHLVVDGYGHAWLCAKLAEHHARLAPRAPLGGSALIPPPLAPVPGAVPLGIAWREVPRPSPRALPLAYALGCALHRASPRPDARFSPTFQIPVAPGAFADPLRRRRRVSASALSVRFTDGAPEPFPAFEARARAILDREAAGRGLIARLLAAARAAPLSLAWKRTAFSPTRPRWLDGIAEVIGGRGCLSRIRVDFPLAPTCAVSSPARLATTSDPLGASVVTLIDDGARAAITVCGSGLAGTDDDAYTLLEQLISSIPP